MDNIEQKIEDTGVKCCFYEICPVKEIVKCDYSFDKINCLTYRNGVKFQIMPKSKFIMMIRMYGHKIITEKRIRILR